MKSKMKMNTALPAKSDCNGLGSEIILLQDIISPVQSGVDFIIAIIISPVQIKPSCHIKLQINLENFQNLKVARIESQKPGGSTFGLVEQYLQ